MESERKKTILSTIILFLFILVGNAQEATFRRVPAEMDLISAQTNCIMRDSRGFIWLATQCGMSRFDGYRFTTFLHDDKNSASLPDNSVEIIQEDGLGRLLVKTAKGYCVFDNMTQTFSSDINEYINNFGIKGQVSYIFIDKDKNLWLSILDQGLYKIDFKNGAKHFLAFGKNLHRGETTYITRSGNNVYVNYSDGYMVEIDANRMRITRQTDFIMKHRTSAKENYKTEVDDRGNLWVIQNNRTFVYYGAGNQWFTSAREFFEKLGYKLPIEGDFVVRTIASDNLGNMWLGSDHKGLFMFNHQKRIAKQYLYSPTDFLTIPDNTIQSLYVDEFNGLWVGTYKNGLAYYSPRQQKFSTILLGDICTITQDANGLLWCGTNDSGIITYDINSGASRTIDMAESGLGSNTVVSSLAARDGSLWFGTWNGGMAHYVSGAWKVYKAEDGSGLANNSVWSLLQLPDGRIAVGTLGSGVQILDPATGQFTTYDSKNNGLISDYVSSLAMGKDGRLLVSNSEGLSMLNLKTGKFDNIKGNRAGIAFPSKLLNQVYQDSRGIIWCATMSGLAAYDPSTDQMTLLNANGGSTDNVICAIGENREHNIWVTNERSLARITVSKEKDGTWGYFVTSYSSIDGLQDRVFNQRSIKLLSDGNMVVGGQDGLNIIPPQPRQRVANTAKALFAGIVLFDHPIQVGEEYDGHVVIDKDINEIRELELTSKEKDFTILLASSEVSLPQKARFLYRLDGFSDKWLLTQEDQSSLTFTSLPAGHYTLNVRVVDHNGVVGKDISSLNITILPPPYLSTWAILIYLIILAFVIYQGRKIIIRRQLARYKLEQSKREVARIKEMEEMKLNFFTNVSHELRTPLMLIISPLQALIKKENEPEKHKTLELILRNAERLLQMVGQILDFRKIEKDKEQLNLVSGDFVVYISHIVANFKALGGKDTSIEFRSNISSLIMAFDADKIRKIVDNLLSNAMKFTPDGGRITVAVNLRNNANASDKAMMEIVVADNGTGIRDEDKKHIFERFYMGSNKNPYGGSGVGLSIAHDFAVLHGGDITVADNKGGGTIFTVTIPVRHDPSLQANDVDAADKLKVDIKDAFVDNSTTTEITEQQKESDAQKDRVEQSREKKSTDKNETSDGSVITDGKKPEDVDNKGVEGKEESGKKKPTVLIVDDSTDFLDFFSNELSQHFNVLTAENGRQALDRISEHKPDLIISDVMMPVMDGNELCKAVKSNKRTADIPFIMLTARLAQEHQIEGLANGADDYVTKPFNLEMLYMRINNLLKWHNAVPDKQQDKLEPKLKHIEITSLDKQLVNDATKYVDDNISDTTLNVESMAKALGMSRVQLYKRLLPVTGSTPTEFIREIRLRRAEQLLRESQLSISEVAYRVGFNNPRYFSKYFKEMYGVMPSQYKK